MQRFFSFIVIEKKENTFKSNFVLSQNVIFLKTITQLFFSKSKRLNLCKKHCSPS